MNSMRVAGTPGWDVTNMDSDFRVRGVLSGDLTDFYQIAMQGTDLLLSADPADLIRNVQPGDWITVEILPGITEAGGTYSGSFQWKFQSGGGGFHDSASLADMVDVQPALSQSLTMSHTVDLNNDHLPDLVLLAGTQIHFYTSSYCPSDVNSGRLLNWSQTLDGISDVNSRGRLYYIIDGDIDNDGFPDLLLFHRYNLNEAYYLHNLTTGIGNPVEFTAPSVNNLDFLTPGDGILKMADIADVTGDGLPDAIILRESTLQIHPGTGNFNAPFQIPAPAGASYSHTYYLTSFAVMDVMDEFGNPGADGKLEILVGHLQQPASRSPAFGQFFRWDGNGLVNTGVGFQIEAAANDERLAYQFELLPDTRGAGGPDLFYRELPGPFHRFLEWDGNPTGLYPMPTEEFLGGAGSRKLASILGQGGNPGLLYLRDVNPANPAEGQILEVVDDVYNAVEQPISFPTILEDPLSAGAVLSVADFDLDGDQDALVIHEETLTNTWEFHYLIDGGRWNLPTLLRWQLHGGGDAPGYIFPDICLGDTSSIEVDLYLDPDEAPGVSVIIDALEITAGGDPDFPDVASFDVVTVNGQPWSGAPLPMSHGDTLHVVLDFSTQEARPHATQLECRWHVPQGASDCYWMERRILTGSASALALAWNYLPDGSGPVAVNQFDWETVCAGNTFDPVQDGCPVDPEAEGCVGRNFQLVNTSELPVVLTGLVVEQDGNREGLIPFCTGTDLTLPLHLEANEARDFSLWFCPGPGAPASYLFEDGFYLRAEFEECGTEWNMAYWSDPANRLLLQASNFCDCPVLAFDHDPGTVLPLVPCYDQIGETWPACDPTGTHRSSWEVQAAPFRSHYVCDSLSMALRDESTGELRPAPWRNAFCFQERGAGGVWQPLNSPIDLVGGIVSLSLLVQPEEDPDFPCGTTRVVIVAHNRSCGVDPDGDGQWQPGDEWVPDVFTWDVDVCYVCDPNLTCLDVRDRTDYSDPACGGVPGTVPPQVQFNDESNAACDTPISTCFTFYNNSPWSMQITDWSSEPGLSMFAIDGQDPQRFVLPPVSVGSPLRIDAYSDFDLVLDYLPGTTNPLGEWHTATLTLSGGPACPGQVLLERDLAAFSRCDLTYPVVLLGPAEVWFPGTQIWDLGELCYQGPRTCDVLDENGGLFWPLTLLNPSAQSTRAFTLSDATLGDTDNLALWVHPDGELWQPFADGGARTVQLDDSLHLALVGCWTCACTGTTLSDSLELVIPEPRYDTDQYLSDEPMRVRMEASVGCDGQAVAEMDSLTLQICALRSVALNVCDAAVPAAMDTVRLQNTCAIDLQILSWTLDAALQPEVCVTLLDALVPAGVFGDNLQVAFRPQFGVQAPHVSGYLTIVLEAADGFSVAPGPLQIWIDAAGELPAVTEDLPAAGDSLFFTPLCPDRPEGSPIGAPWAQRVLDFGLATACAEGQLTWSASLSGPDRDQFSLVSLQSTVDGTGGLAELSLIHCPEIGLAGEHHATLDIQVFGDWDPGTILASFTRQIRGESYGSGSSLTGSFALEDSPVATVSFCPFRFSDQAAGLDLQLSLQNTAAPVTELQIAGSVIATGFSGSVETISPPVDVDGNGSAQCGVRLLLDPLTGDCLDPLDGALNLQLDWQACDGPRDTLLVLPFTLSCLTSNLTLSGGLVETVAMCPPWDGFSTAQGSLSLTNEGDPLAGQAFRIRAADHDWPGIPGDWEVLADWTALPEWLPAGDSGVWPLSLQLYPGADLAVQQQQLTDWPQACSGPLTGLEWPLQFERACIVEEPVLATPGPLDLCGDLDGQPGPDREPERGLETLQLRLQPTTDTGVPLEITGWRLKRGGTDFPATQWGDTTLFADEFPGELEYEGLGLWQRLLALPADTLDPGSTVQIDLENQLVGFWPDWRINPPEEPLLLGNLALELDWKSIWDTQVNTLTFSVPLRRVCEFPELLIPDNLDFSWACQPVLHAPLALEHGLRDVPLNVWLELPTGGPFHFEYGLAPLAAAVHKGGRRTASQVWRLDALPVPMEGLAVDMGFTAPVSRDFDQSATLNIWSNHPRNHWSVFGEPLTIDLHAQHVAAVPHAEAIPANPSLQDPGCDAQPQNFTVQVQGWNCRSLRAFIDSPAGPYRLSLALAEDCSAPRDTLDIPSWQLDDFELCLNLTTVDGVPRTLDAWTGQFMLHLEDEQGEVLVLPIPLDVLPCDVSLRLFLGTPPGTNGDEFRGEPWERQFELPFGVEITGGPVAAPVLVRIHDSLHLTGGSSVSNPDREWIGGAGLTWLQDTVLTGTALYDFIGMGQAQACLDLLRPINLQHEWIVFQDSLLCLSNDTDVQPFELNRNVVTPNGDGINDEICFVFQRGYDLSRMKVGVYSLSGVEVHRARPDDSQPRVCWDGRGPDNGELLPGPYLYAVWIGSEVKYRGQLVLIK
ncbi:MAG: gliding motility-associated C-terminal domain-containing protein [Candidatus Delongbacteria bacterium]|nr:gliding motility-associated C-terminal domain-containing protein [Candidatus Delongbacteria bacterium]